MAKTEGYIGEITSVKVVGDDTQFSGTITNDDGKVKATFTDQVVVGRDGSMVKDPKTFGPYAYITFEDDNGAVSKITRLVYVTTNGNIGHDRTRDRLRRLTGAVGDYEPDTELKDILITNA